MQNRDHNTAGEERYGAQKILETGACHQSHYAPCLIAFTQQNTLTSHQ